jgi:flagellar capping protein FliD
MALSVSGFVSGLDVNTIVSQLMTSESYPKTLLQNQLTTVKTDAAAYREVNTKFNALKTAAQALSAASFGSNVTASSTDTSVTASATTAAASGSSVSFTVKTLAAAQTVVSASTWASTTAPLDSQEPVWPLTVLDSTGKSVGQIKLPANGTLNDAASAINSSSYGLKATVVQLDSSHFKLQVTSASTGKAGAFTLQSADETSGTTSSSFTTTRTAQDATLDLGNGMTATSSTNTFSNLISGVSLAVSATTSSPATVTVGTDTSGITKKMQALVDAANAVLTDIDQNTNTTTNSNAALAGDYSVQSLAQQVLQAVSDAVGTVGVNGATGPSSSPAAIGLQLTKSGQITFDSSVFSKALTTTPDLARQLVAGTAAVPGIATRLQTLANHATDSVTGTLVTLANGEDSRAKDLQNQIDAWTLRLADRQDQLTTLYSNLQSTLSGLQNQSSWLSSMFSSSTSSSSKSSS